MVDGPPDAGPTDVAMDRVRCLAGELVLTNGRSWMARNKNSTALFDVIHAAKKPPKASPSASIPTPRWWGKDRKDKKVPQPVPSVATENVGRQTSWLTAAKKNGVAPISPASTDSAAIPAPVADQNLHSSEQIDETAVLETVAEPVPAGPKVRFIDRFKNRAAPATGNPAVNNPATNLPSASEPVSVSTETTDSIAAIASHPDSDWTDSEFVQAKPEPRKAASRDSRDSAIRIDPSAREFSFRLSYGGLVAIGFIFLMALAIAFIAGKHTGMETADADSTAAQKATGNPSTAGVPTAGLMAGVAPTKSDAASSAKGTPTAISPSVLKIGPGNPRPASQTESAGGVTPAVAELPTKATREIGLNYVIIQLYDDLDRAQKACDFINKNSDIQCTVVQGPRDWAPHNWYSVIGLRPFRPFSKQDPALAEYIHKIRVLGVKFSSNVLNQFNDPREYTWRGDSEAPPQ